MSTIASPREPSINGRRGAPLISTPTSSARPSFDAPRSSDPSPNRGPLSLPQGQLHAAPRRNRAALREYYNLKAVSAASKPQDPETASTTSSIHDNSSHSSVQESELDSPDFVAGEYVKRILETQNLGELLKTYNGVLGDIRALDAEKKALVYDNYSKLITATETIGKMREDMGKGGAGEGVVGREGLLDGAVRGVFDRAEGLRAELRRELDKRNGGVVDRGEIEQRRKTRMVVEKVLKTPAKLKELIEEEREDEAKELWQKTLAVLERWKERGVGGSDVQACIDEGEVALQGATFTSSNPEESRQDPKS